MNESTPVVVYAAKSTADHHGSCASQVEECRAYAERQGWQVVEPAESEEDESGYLGSRGPALVRAQERAAALAREHGEAVLLTYKSDRLARGDGVQAKHLVERTLEALKDGYRLVAFTDGFDSASPMALAFAGMIGEQNHGYSKSLSDHVTRGLRTRVRKGRYVGGIPYGYRFERDYNDPDDEGRLVPVPEEAEVVRRMHAEYLAGRGFATIAAGLRADRIPTRQGYAWLPRTVARIIGRPAYAGLLRSGEETFPGEHEPLIDAETYERVRALREARVAVNRGRGRRPRLHLLNAQLLRCGRCGGGMTPKSGGGRNGGYYVCVKRFNGGDCDAPRIYRKKLDQAVLAYFLASRFDYAATIEAATAEARRELAEASELAEAAEREAAKTEAAVSRFDADYTEGRLSAERYSRLVGAAEEGREAARAESARLRQRVDELEAALCSLDTEEEVAAKLHAIRDAVAGRVAEAEGLDAVRAALTSLFETFTVEQDDDRLQIVPKLRTRREREGRRKSGVTWDCRESNRTAS